MGAGLAIRRDCRPAVLAIHRGYPLSNPLFRSLLPHYRYISHNGPGFLPMSLALLTLLQCCDCVCGTAAAALAWHTRVLLTHTRYMRYMLCINCTARRQSGMTDDSCLVGGALLCRGTWRVVCCTHPRTCAVPRRSCVARCAHCHNPHRCVSPMFVAVLYAN